MNFNFDQPIERRGTNSVKWDMLKEDILPMWVADMDFQAPPVVINTLRKIVDHGVFGYPCDSKKEQQAVANWMFDQHGWQISPDDVVMLPGVVTGFNLAAHAFTLPGESVLIQTPAYERFLDVAKNAEISQQEMVLTIGKDMQYSVDMDAFESSITESTKIFMLCNPHNPTGRVFNKEELEEMAGICLRKKVMICSDEIHSDLVYSGQKHIPIASLDEEIARNTITLIAPSKTFNIAGLKSAAVIIQNKELRQQYQAAYHGLVGWVNSMGAAALVAAFGGGKPWLKELIVYLENNRNYLFNYVNSELPGIRMAKPEGTYLAWLDCNELGIDDKPAEFFRDRAKVELNDGKIYGKGGEGFVRLNFGCPRSQLEEALSRMKRSLETR